MVGKDPRFLIIFLVYLSLFFQKERESLLKRRPAHLDAIFLQDLFIFTLTILLLAIPF